MTGDGAVVRVRAWDDQVDMPAQRSDGAGFGFDTWRKLVAEHNAAIRQQAAEIERLTGDLKSALSREKTMTETAMVIVARAEASEARTADLLKALEWVSGEFDRYVLNDVEKEIDARIKAALAAAKGETV